MTTLTANTYEPLYLQLGLSELKRRAEEAHERMAACDLCGRECRVDRLGGRLGPCRSGPQATVSSYGPHFGEESVLRGWNGSGTIFFTFCNMRCLYCQNYDISILGQGSTVSDEDLAAMMLQLQRYGCHNINLVSPSHVVAPILRALVIAVEQGLRLPLVYNTGGYDSMPALRLLDGVVDIYMPDMKYADARTARRFSGIPRYVEVNRAAVKEMHRQVGDLQVDEHGLARRGLLIRHLVLPENLAGSEEVLTWIARELGPDTYLNIMDQYRPAYKADRLPPLHRPLARREYQAVVETAHRLGLHRLHRETSFVLRWAWV